MVGTILRKFSGSGMKLKGSGTLSGGVVTLSGLNLATDTTYQINFFLVNDANAGENVLITFNGDTTATNYNEQKLQQTGGTVTGGAGNNNIIFNAIAASTFLSGTATLSIGADGKVHMDFICGQGTTGSVQQNNTGHLAWNGTNVTSIEFRKNAHSLDTGSTFTVWSIQ